MGAALFALRATAQGDIINKLNAEFGLGNIKTVALKHMNLNAFSMGDDLKLAYSLLGIYPDDAKERRLWFVYLDSLKRFGSTLGQANAHDDIIVVRKTNLESATPLPMHTTTHHDTDPYVRVTNPDYPDKNNPTQPYVTISSPVPPNAPPARSRPTRAPRKRS